VREYETVFVIHPKVDEAGIEREIDAAKQTIEAGGAELIGVHKWGRRKLAYSIKKVNDGFYVLMRFNGEPELLTALDRKFKLNEQILRHLTVISPGGDWPPELKARERRTGRREMGGGRGRRDFGDDFVPRNRPDSSGDKPEAAVEAPSAETKKPEAAPQSSEVVPAEAAPAPEVEATPEA